MNRSSFVSKLFTPVITLLVLAYFGYQIYGYVSDPFSTTLAYTYQVEDTVDISGYVVRQEQVLTGDAGGLMRLRKNEGERVGTGGAVATVYADQASLDRQNEIETLNNRIEQLEYAQESMLGAEVTLKLDSQIARSLLDYRTVVAAGRLDAAESRGQELRSLVLKRDYTYSGTEDLSGQLQELKNQLKTLRSQAANSVKTIRSPRSGLFSAVVDGYESVLTPDSLSALTPSALNKLSPAELPANTGKLILGDNWYYVGVVSAQEAQTLQTRQNRLGTGESLSLRFTKNVDRGPVGHAVVRGRGGKRPLCGDFQGNTYLQELTLLRRQSAEIILDTTDGLRVPLAALRVATQTVTEKDPETEETASKEVNVTGVYCVSGAKARFKPVEVLLTGDDYAVVRSAGSTEKLRLRPGDEIIVAARDLYDGKVVS
ncbi:MAG: HlyD family efflux transporter periplasmic adaptor subunit [Dysosmobacter sp.]